MGDVKNAVSIETLRTPESDASAEKEQEKKGRLSLGVLRTAKVLLSLFVLFIVVTSDGFVDHVLDKFDGGVDGGVPTSYGTVVQGIFLVFFYAIVVYLMDMDLV